jgi:hypothetical protein
MVSELISWREVCHRFPDQWVSLVGLDFADDEARDVVIGFVAGTGTRDEAVQQAKPLRSMFESLGTFHTGGASAAPAVPVFVHVS